jgi:hypothetical protein
MPQMKMNHHEVQALVAESVNELVRELIHMGVPANLVCSGLLDVTNRALVSLNGRNREQLIAWLDAIKQALIEQGDEYFYDD